MNPAPALPKPPASLPALAFIGGGNMASAMIKAVCALAQVPSMVISEPDPDKRATFTAQGLVATADNGMATASAQLICLAIKPQMAAQVVPEIAAAWTPDKILVSILAGMSTAKLAAWMPESARIVRAMPNTPLAIGEGMVGLCPGQHADEHDLALAEALFAPCARVLRISNEARMDAVTAVSGSGPAYFFAFAEALLGAAQQLGFTRDEAVLLVGQTGAGSWRYLLETGFDAKRLREQVTSPGGTTAAALAVLQQGNFNDLIGRALNAAERRGKELGAS